MLEKEYRDVTIHLLTKISMMPEAMHKILTEEFIEKVRQCNDPEINDMIDEMLYATNQEALLEKRPAKRPELKKELPEEEWQEEWQEEYEELGEEEYYTPAPKPSYLLKSLLGSIATVGIGITAWAFNHDAIQSLPDMMWYVALPSCGFAALAMVAANKIPDAYFYSLSTITAIGVLAKIAHNDNARDVVYSGIDEVVKLLTELTTNFVSMVAAQANQPAQPSIQQG
jgi:hypothetical protein